MAFEKKYVININMSVMAINNFNKIIAFVSRQKLNLNLTGHNYVCSVSIFLPLDQYGSPLQ